MARVVSGSVKQLLLELQHDQLDDQWLTRGHWDPMFGASELRQAHRRGLIELEIHADPEQWRFRVLPAGVTAIQALEAPRDRVVKL